MTKQLPLTLLILFLFLFIRAGQALPLQNCLKDKKEQVVTAVCDGDTIVIEKGSCKTGFPENKIRLLGIDAFEMGQEPYGKKSKDFLTKLLLNKKVCIETDVDKKDIYNRTLGYVFVIEDFSFINEEILKTGHAILYDFPPNTKYIDRLKKAQTYARKNMIGIWEKQNYIEETPAQWRHKNKS